VETLGRTAIRKQSWGREAKPALSKVREFIISAQNTLVRASTDNEVLAGKGLALPSSLMGIFAFVCQRT
jgi:hypothetical protein